MAVAATIVGYRFVDDTNEAGVRMLLVMAGFLSTTPWPMR